MIWTSPTKGKTSNRSKSLSQYQKHVHSVAIKQGISLSEARSIIKRYVHGGNALLRKRRIKGRITWRDHKKKTGRGKKMPDFYKDYWVEE